MDLCGMLVYYYNVLKFNNPIPLKGVSDKDNTPFHEEATSYLKIHKIPELFEHLTASLVYYRPENPQQFIAEHLKKLQDCQDSSETSNPPSLFDESNLISIFGMLDISGRGHISLEQYKEAMLSLGIEKYNENPAGGELNKIGRETFIREASYGLNKCNQTFSDE